MGLILFGVFKFQIVGQEVAEVGKAGVWRCAGEDARRPPKQEQHSEGPRGSSLSVLSPQWKSVRHYKNCTGLKGGQKQPSHTELLALSSTGSLDRRVPASVCHLPGSGDRIRIQISGIRIKVVIKDVTMFFAGGTLRIYADSLKPNIPYKTILLSTTDPADFAVAEALEKYGLEKENPKDYCIARVSTRHAGASPYYTC